MPGYIIVRAQVTNWDKYREYIQATPEVIAKFGGRFIVRGGQVVNLEGPQETSRVVVIEFPTLEKAVEFYYSDEYAEARTLREGAAEFQLIAVEGLLR